MNPIPITWCVAAALATSALGFGAGWQAHSWKADSAQLKTVKKETKAIDAQNAHSVAAAASYEKDKADAESVRERTNTEIRTIYRDRVVRADCDLDPAARGLLDQAIEAANQRTAGEPATGLPEAAASADPVRPAGKRGVDQ